MKGFISYQIDKTILKRSFVRTISALVGILAVGGASAWRVRPALAQTPASTADCVARALNKIWREHRDASVSDLFNRCRISGRAAAVADIAPSTAPRTTAGALNLAERPDSAPLPQADAGENQPPMPTQSGPANQDEDRRLASASSPIRTNLNTGADAGGASVTQPSTAAGPTVNVKDYGASGSDNTYTCSIDAGSTTLTCTTPTDFQVGQYVAVPTAGPATPLTPAGMPIVTNLGTPGSTTDCYEIVAGDPGRRFDGAISAGMHHNRAGRSSQPLRTCGVIYRKWQSNTAYGIYRSINGAPYVLVNVATEYSYNDYGGDLPASYDWAARAPSARNQTLYAMILEGSGTTWTLDATAATRSGWRQGTPLTTPSQSRPATTLLLESRSTFRQVPNVNMILLLLGSTPAGYRYTPATRYYHAAGSILETGNSISHREHNDQHHDSARLGLAL